VYFAPISWDLATFASTSLQGTLLVSSNVRAKSDLLQIQQTMMPLPDYFDKKTIIRELIHAFHNTRFKKQHAMYYRL
jgi:hypothetical protein